MKYVVFQIRDKGGVRTERVELADAPIQLGRAWSSDIILQDRFVSPEHLSLSLGDGGVLLLTDLASTNGTQIKGEEIRGESVAYHLGDAIRIGDTTVRIYDHAVGVAEASIRSAWFLLAERFRSFPALLVLTLLAIAAVLLSSWVFSSTPFRRSDALSQAFSTIVLMAVWSLVLGFLGKLIRGESGFRAFWILACFAIILLELLGMVLVAVRFNLQNVSAGEVLSLIAFGAVGIIVLVGVLTYASHLGRRAKWLASTVIVLTCIGLIKSGDLLKEEHQRWNDQSSIETATLPQSFLWRRSVSVEEYQRDVDDLFEFEELQ